MVKINGEEMAVAGQTLTQYLAAAKYNPALIAVEKNCEIVPKRFYDVTVLQDGDTLEIVSFVGGG